MKIDGPFELNAETIDKKVPQGQMGYYILGKTKDNLYFYTCYVGRSDTDLRARLKQHINEGYTLFKYGTVSSAKAAFEAECLLYHEYKKQIDNLIHPDRPDNAPHWKCPESGCNL